MFNPNRSFIRPSARPLTLDEIAQRAPSALAVQAHQSTSSRYTYIPTVAVIEGMQRAGFFPFSATQARTRVEDRREFCKHMIRFRHESTQQMVVGQSLPEIVLINAHDGSSAYQLMGGIFRLVCSNGMIVSEGQLDAIRVKHSGNIIEGVIAGSNRIVGNAPRLLDTVSRWTGLQLTAGEQQAFAESAHLIRFADHEGKVDTPILPAQLLRPRRYEDNKPDLWSTMNRVQENTIRGGLHGVGRDNLGRRRVATTRPINGIDQDVKLNRALWALAERMAELKGAAA